MAGICGRAWGVVLAALLLLTLGAHPGQSAPPTRAWTSLDASQVDLTGTDGTHTRVERRATGLLTLRASGGPDGVTLRLLPAGRWRDYWTGAVQTGPSWILAAAPTQQIPLFVRDGSPLVLPPPQSLQLPTTP